MSRIRAAVPDGILAGVMVSIGGAVLLSVDNRYIGAALFSIALLVICYFGFNLYTGKVGFLWNNHDREALSMAFLGLLGNLLGTVLVGVLLAAALPQLRETALAACEKRLTQLPLQTVIRGFFCGILMYSAVWIYREKKTVTGILFCIPVFILAGFEHSVADMFYFALAGLFNVKAIGFILLVVLGNSLGGVFIPAVQSLKGESKP
ncbi:MAG: formate/nitrite transporter family protein [Oscillospiraceae bacterium]|nr:formate/nitrite transporter family protein [Oscillospiraceae bacterium]